MLQIVLLCGGVHFDDIVMFNVHSVETDAVKKQKEEAAVWT